MASAGNEQRVYTLAWEGMVLDAVFHASLLTSLLARAKPLLLLRHPALHPPDSARQMLAERDRGVPWAGATGKEKRAALHLQPHLFKEGAVKTRTSPRRPTLSLHLSLEGPSGSHQHRLFVIRCARTPS